MLSTKSIIFDFDGTIADTLSACINIANKNATAWGFKQVDERDIERLKGMSPFELLAEFKIPFYKVPFLIKKFQLELFEGMDSVKPFSGMKEVLSKLQSEKYLLGIITSNTEENVNKFLEKNDFHTFNFVHNEKNILGKHKTILNVIHEHGLLKKDTVYVGDEVRDIEAARKSGIECISVSWGFNTRKLLEKHSKTVVSSPKDLLQAIKEQTR